MTLQEFWDALEAHDWYYHFSDSGSVFSKGKKSEDRLLKLASTSVEYNDMFQAFRGHYFSGPQYSTPRIPKPERPGGPRDVSKSQVPF